MSLEEKFANLKIDDATSVVDSVKADGVEKSGLAANASVLAARCGSKDEAEALGALATVKALAEGSPVAQVFTKECLGACKYILSRTGIGHCLRKKVQVEPGTTVIRQLRPVSILGFFGGFNFDQTTDNSQNFSSTLQVWNKPTARVPPSRPPQKKLPLLFATMLTPSP